MYKVTKLSVVSWGLGVVAWSRVIRGSLVVVCWGSVGSSVILRCLSGVVLGSLGVVSWGSIRSRVVLRCLGGVVIRSLSVVSWGSIRRRVVLGRFRGIARGRVILGFFGVVT